MTLNRRTALRLTAGVFSVAALPTAAADFEKLKGRRIVLIEAYGAGSITYLPLSLMQAAISARTGAPVTILTVSGDGGAAALEYACNPPPSAGTDSVFFHVGDLTTLLLRQASGVKVPLLEKVLPVGKLSTGISSALIVSDNSPLRSIDDFIAEGRKRPISMATFGRRAPFGLELTMLERQLKLSFTEKPISTREEILAALASGDAEGSFLITRTVVAAPRVVPPPVRVLLTFGAQRSSRTPTVPTLADKTGDPKQATTGSVLMFTSTANAALVDAMISLLGEAAAETAVKHAAEDVNFPLEITPASYAYEEGRRFKRIMHEYPR
jgi:tripartite-type tricarboxylate transporter receptor subunit TctC